MNYWSLVPDDNYSILDTWEYIIKPGIARLARDHQREVFTEWFGSLHVLFMKLGFLSAELQLGDLSVLPNLHLAQLEIEEHYRLESEKSLSMPELFKLNRARKQEFTIIAFLNTT